MVLGSSLAHGVASRAITQSTVDFKQKVQAMRKKVDAVRHKRAARYRALCAGIKDVFSDNLLFFNSEGDQNGKDKKAFCNYLGFTPSDDGCLAIHFVSLRAKDLTMKAVDKMIINEHSYARLLQTYRTKDIKEIFTQNKKADLMRLLCCWSYLDGNDRQFITQGHALALEKGELRFCWDKKEKVIRMRTIISYDAMSPIRADEVRNLIPTGTPYEWRSYAGECEQ